MSNLSKGRLSLLQAAFVVARRDFTAILFSRAFIFFLLGPLFPVVVMGLAGGLGAQAASNAPQPTIGIAMEAADMDAMLAARTQLADKIGPAIPPMEELQRLEPGESFNAREVLEGQEGELAAIVTGTPAQPVLTGTQEWLGRWQGIVALISAQASGSQQMQYPAITTQEVATSGASQNTERMRTAQGSQVLLFLLIMLLASMVLSNLVEEKGNKIIEVLAAAIPMDAVFYGKLFAMLAISIVGILVWGSAATAVLTIAGISLSDYANPGVGWPVFFVLFSLYFAMGYLLLGAIFLTIGSQAKTVREVQTLSMPATMLQVLVFFLASLSVTVDGGWLEYSGMAFPLSSPFVMVAYGAKSEALWPHALALAWQMMWVGAFVHFGARLFRSRVMKSGMQGAKAKAAGGGFLRRLFSKGSKAAQ